MKSFCGVQGRFFQKEPLVAEGIEKNLFWYYNSVMEHDQFNYRQYVAFINREKELEEVRNNILYFDPTEAIYYPQGKSYQWGIRLYFENLS